MTFIVADAPSAPDILTVNTITVCWSVIILVQKNIYNLLGFERLVEIATFSERVNIVSEKYEQ